MVTFRQLEALYWIGRLGSFDAAAKRLDASQSTISRRIQDLENLAETPLFDRAYRSPTLTRKGLDLYRRAGELIAMRDGFSDALSGPGTLSAEIMLGATDISALSWLPVFLEKSAERYPSLNIRLRIADARTLRQEMVESMLDLAVLPETLPPPQLSARPLANLKCILACRAGSPLAGRIKRFEDLTSVPLIAQQNQLFSILVNDLFDKEEKTKLEIMTSDSLLGLISICLSGRGVTLLPDFLLKSASLSKQLQRLLAEHPIPLLRYQLLQRRNENRPIIEGISEMIDETCRFDQIFGLS